MSKVEGRRVANRMLLKAAVFRRGFKSGFVVLVRADRFSLESPLALRACSPPLAALCTESGGWGSAEREGVSSCPGGGYVA